MDLGCRKCFYLGCRGFLPRLLILNRTEYVIWALSMHLTYPVRRRSEEVNIHCHFFCPQKRNQKRDKAQMTRKLKRQLQQALSRNQLRRDKAHFGLRQNIAKVESKLDREEKVKDDEACQLELNLAELDNKIDE